tara:strand:- start:7898 stop:8593 length:696 start_codon:yes stop_codon:yes gene_type:complete
MSITINHQINDISASSGSITIDGAAAAPLASPTFTGVPAAPTAAEGTDTTQIATTAFVLANAGGGSIPTAQTFEASGTWTRPAGCRYVRMIVTGGGGGGGGNSNNSGGSGATAIKVIDVSAIATATLTIGAPGAGSSGNNSTPGSASSWVDGTNTITGGGSVNNADSTATGGDINLVGVEGGEGGGGAGSFWGPGVNGNIAGRYWGGGGNSRNNSTGYAGKGGVIFIEEFY